MAQIPPEVQARMASALEILGQDFAETAFVMRKATDAIAAFGVELALASLEKAKSGDPVKEACDQAMSDLTAILRRAE